MSEVLGKIQFLDTPEVNNVPVLLNAGNTPSVSADILANRPAPGVAGRLFVDTTNNLLQRDTGSAWVNIGPPQGVYVLDKSVVTATYTTTAGGPLMSVTIPGGTLGTDTILRVRSSGYIINSSGGNRQVVLSVSYGGTNMWQDTSTNISSGNSVGWNADFVLASNNSVTSQTLNGIITIGGTGGQAAGITGDLGTDEIVSNAVISGTSAVNSANNQTLLFEHVSSSGTGVSFVRTFYFIEVL